MIHPSYVDLMKVVNKDVEEGEEPVISSRYSIVMATARRARQLIAGDDPLIRTKTSQKPLSIAVEELNQDEIHILTEEDKERMAQEALFALTDEDASGEQEEDAEPELLLPEDAEDAAPEEQPAEGTEDAAPEDASADEETAG